MLSGDTAEVPFIIIATLVLGAFLVGWRAITALLRRRRNSPDAAEATRSESLDEPND